MTNKSNEILQALNYVYRELSKWSLRNAANDNPSAALVFFSFLKYVSDNKQKLSLEFDEKFNFDFLSVLFGERLRRNDLVAHIANIEKQLGHGYGILESYASSIDLDSFDRQDTQIWEVLNSVDMSDLNDEHVVYEALANYFSVTVKKKSGFPESVSQSKISLNSWPQLVVLLMVLFMTLPLAMGFWLRSAQKGKMCMYLHKTSIEPVPR
ncbi:hypothetical protein EAL2_c04630 [Peptoclostridium acidaminophilum DSM 3953]|uniref:Uncharacterized protein n=1 Tax=Peptoclostridium acidaminophilum DSM 3953 TaxID=1286171 RepID=W8T4K2_PEPAC|nr:hypothetical protein EAL2_c04630 [Peptoclostridium acidaminophilum DSM 3953]